MCSHCEDVFAHERRQSEDWFLSWNIRMNYSNPSGDVSYISYGKTLRFCNNGCHLEASNRIADRPLATGSSLASTW